VVTTNIIRKSKINKVIHLLNGTPEIISMAMANHESFLVNTISKSDLSTPVFNSQNFSLVWLDANIDEINNPDCHNTIIELRHFVKTICTFADEKLCIKFLMSIRNGTAAMIVSGSLGQSIMSHVHDISQLTAIYVFCRDKSKHEHWVTNWSKIKGVFTDVSDICNALIQSIPQGDQDSSPVSFVSMNNTTSTANFTQLDQSFMYTQILKEILLDINFSEVPIKEFISYCRNHFANNKKELDYIKKLEHEYRQHTPIWWYTNECFLHSMLNQALRKMDVDIIIKMGFFVKDLHRQIEKLHRKQHGDPKQFQSFIVYRGQGLSTVDFYKMRRIEEGLISFNNFVSSSKKRDVAEMFARRALTDSDSMGIVFKMTINSAIYSTPFALVGDAGYFKGKEQEILFSMHTIFRIGKINPIEVNNNRLWEVDLTLTNDNDQQHTALTQRLREDTQGAKGWYCLAQFLLKIGKFDKAKELYNFLLNQTSNKKEKAYIYHQLGWIEDNSRNYVAAISFYEKGLTIDEKTLPAYHPDLATSYNNIGSVYDRMSEYSKAVSFHEKALLIYRRILAPDHHDLATSLTNIGLVYYKSNEYDKALSSHKEALEIYKKTLPSNHPLLAASYTNLGSGHDKLDDYAKALWCYEKSLEIYQKTSSADHPDLAICHQNIGKAVEKMSEHSKALSCFEKALRIFQKTLSSNHPHVATCYSCIASVYNNMEDYPKALSFYEKALDIRQKALSPNHADLFNSYNNIAEVYERMNEYFQALSFYLKAMQVCPRNLASNRLLLASSYHNVAKAHYNMGHPTDALPYAEDAVNIGQSILPSGHSVLQTYYKTLELVRKML
jgi:tetratricopeptide (TPR) repeat protein